MLVLKNEFNDIITHPYFKYEDTLENKKDFSNKLYKFFFHIRDVVYKIGNPETIKAVNCGMHDWIRYTRNIGYYENINLTTEQKFDIASYLNIVFREISYFIVNGKFNTITKGRTSFYVPEYPLYPQYKYCKTLEEWKLYLSKEKFAKLYESLKEKFKGREEEFKFILEIFEKDLNNWDEYWGNK